MSRRAVILAGGRGVRLRPYTIVLPKPLVPVGEYPILEIIVRQLVRNGFDHITMAVNYQADIIKAFFQGGERWGVRIDYSLEEKPLGTMGPLRLISDLPDNFLIMNGDVLTDINYAHFHDEHVERGELFTISSMRREHQIDYGVLKANSDERLVGFYEKPHESYLVSMGVYMFSLPLMRHIPDGSAYGFDNLMLDMLSHGQSARVRPFDGYWLDIGRPDDYAKAIDAFGTMKETFLGT